MCMLLANRAASIIYLHVMSVVVWANVMNAWRTLFTGRVTFAIALDRSAAFNARIVDCASADAPQ